MRGQRDSSTDEGLRFLRTLAPLVGSGDICRAEETVRRYWPQGRLLEFLSHSDSRVGQLAAMALGCVGDCGAVGSLVEQLRNPNSEMAQTAEHALWSIWLRAGSCKSLRYLKCGCDHLKHGNHETAIEKFSMAIGEDPDFAEAFNQRAIAYYLSGDYEKSISDCHQALARMPSHFGAIAGMGHCYAQLDKLHQARHCYQAALRLHPGMDGIVESLQSVERLLEIRKT